MRFKLNKKALNLMFLHKGMLHKNHPSKNQTTKEVVFLFHPPTQLW